MDSSISNYLCLVFEQINFNLKLQHNENWSPNNFIIEKL